MSRAKPAYPPAKVLLAMVRLRPRTWLIVGVIAVACVAGAVYRWDRWLPAGPDHRICLAHMQTIARIWTHVMGDAPPDPAAAVQWLMQMGYVTKDDLVCPYADAGALPFVFRRPSGNITGVAPILIEPKPNHNGAGGLIVFSDGRAAFVAVPRYDDWVRSSGPMTGNE